MIDYHERGMRYRDAIRLISGARFPGGLSPYDDGSEEGPLKHRLINGDWHATARLVVGQGKEPLAPNVVPGDQWSYLEFDCKTHKAVGGGLAYVDVRLHVGAPTQSDQARPKRRGRKPGDGEYDDREAVAEAIRLYETGKANSKSKAVRMAIHLAADGASPEATHDRVRRKMREQLDIK